MKTITVNPMPDSVPVGGEYTASNYPASGCYERNGMLYFVNGGVQALSSSVVMFNGSSVVSPAALSGIDPTVFLKAMAIAHQPELAKDIL